MSCNGTPETGPMRAGAPISDLVAGLYAALGTVAALYRRSQTGRWEQVAVAMVDSLLSLGVFRTNDLRVLHRAAINAHINARVAQAPKTFSIERLNAAGVPCGVVMNLADVFADPQVVSQEMVLAIPHPGHGTVTLIPTNFQFHSEINPFILACMARVRRLGVATAGYPEADAAERRKR
jgi:crotonobetainyl-CoA:carnitine CoA-transferase CaiB-like acyl-CoA transferase